MSILFLNKKEFKMFSKNVPKGQMEFVSDDKLGNYTFITGFHLRKMLRLLTGNINMGL